MTKFHSIVISLSFLFLFFVWGTAGNFLLPFYIFFPQYHIILGAILILFLILGKEFTITQTIFSKLVAFRYHILPFAGLSIALLINFLAFDNIPHVQDGIHYKYMAETFANGTLSQDMPVHYEFFEYAFFMVDGTRHFSLFMPGFSLFLTPFAVFGLTFLANPILTGLNILLIGKFAQYLFNEKTSLYSMLLFVFSPFMMTIGGTWMAHPFSAMLTIIAVFSFLESWKTERIAFPLISGFAIGWLMLTRPQNALFLTIVLGITGFFYCRQKSFLRKIALFSVTLFIWLAILFAYNFNFTERPFTFVQAFYFDVSEPGNNCHSIGLGRGCQHCNGASLPFGGMTWQQGINVTKERMVPLVMQTFPHPLFFVFTISSLLFTSNSQTESRRKIFLTVLFAAPIIGYFLFYFDGNVFGPRYLYEGTVFLIIVTAAGIDFLIVWLKDRESSLGKTVIKSFLVASVLFEMVFSLPRFLTIYQNGFWGVGHLLKEKAKEEGIENSVIFLAIQNSESYGSGLVAMNLGKLEQNSNIFVKDLGDASNSKYMHYLKGREFYRVKYVPWKDRSVELHKIRPKHTEGFIHVEFEDKFLPYSAKEGYPNYCNRYPIRNDIYRYVEFPEMKNIEFSRDGSLYCRFEDSGQRYVFGQYFSQDGGYHATIAAVSGSVFGDFDIFLDGRRVAAIEIPESKDNILTTFNFEFEVSKGLHTFEIGLQKGSLIGRNYLMLDYIEFVRLNEE